MVSPKRKADSSFGPSSKKPRYDEQSRVDPATGFRNALPGVDSFDSDPEDEGYEDEDEEAQRTREAMKYLRSVRQEAAGIPDVLVASATKRRAGSGNIDGAIIISDDEEDIYAEEGLEERDTRGFYHEGVYAAYPNMGPRLPPPNSLTTNPETPRLVSAQSAYHTALLQRYDALRHRLRDAPGEDFNRADSASYNNWTPNAGKREAWLSVIAGTDLKMAQLATLPKQNALWMLELLGDEFLSKEVMDHENIGKRITLWLWGLLARVGECETMASEEVSKLREVGKKTVFVAKTLLEPVDKETADEAPAEGMEQAIDQDDSAVYEEPVEEGNTTLNGYPTEPRTQSRQYPDEDLDERRGDSTRRRNSSSSIESASENVGFSTADTDRNLDKGGIHSLSSIMHGHPIGLPQSNVHRNDHHAIAPHVNPRTNGSGSSHAPADEVQQVEDRDQTKTQAQMNMPLTRVVPEAQTNGQHTEGFIATLDFILTIVGERYGQRDLLWARDELWSMHEDRQI